MGEPAWVVSGDEFSDLDGSTGGSTAVRRAACTWGDDGGVHHG